MNRLLTTPTSPATRVRALPRALAVGLAAAASLVAAACASGGTGSGGGDPAAGPGPGPVSAETASREGPRGSGPATPADAAFMRGMIHHHAQAVAMVRLAPDRAESPAVRRLTARILNSQRTEIDLMADWLRDRGEPVPEIAGRALDAAGATQADAGEAGVGGADPGKGGAGSGVSGTIAPPGGWDAGPQMPGVLSDEKMSRLEAARGEEFDRLFLTFMIEHHEGAVTMVRSLVDSPDGAREESVFRLASGIRSDQSAEIDRMREMLRELLFGT